MNGERTLNASGSASSTTSTRSWFEVSCRAIERAVAHPAGPPPTMMTGAANNERRPTERYDN